MKRQPLIYYMHDGPAAFRFELSGSLSGESSARLEQDWRTAASVVGDRKRIVDITFVTAADESGAALLQRWRRDGARFVAKSSASMLLAESIFGEPLANSAAPAEARDLRWRPFRSRKASGIAATFFLAAMLFPSGAQAANLKAETIAAWDEYVQQVNTNFQERLRPGAQFFWTLESPAREVKLHAGEIVVAPASKQMPHKVPGGLIHHWIGATLIPDLKLADIFGVTRNYDRYKEFYPPSVIESKTVATEDTNDKFSIRLMNRAFFLKTALDTDCEAKLVRLDNKRFYSVSKTTRVQEIEEYGQPGEHKMSDGEGSGYIWRLYSIMRYEQRSDGVLVEIEAMALSRDIPGALHVIVDPIVRRVSKSSLVTSLQQTSEAARKESATVASSHAARTNAPAYANR